MTEAGVVVAVLAGCLWVVFDERRRRAARAARVAQENEADRLAALAEFRYETKVTDGWTAFSVDFKSMRACYQWSVDIEGGCRESIVRRSDDGTWQLKETMKSFMAEKERWEAVIEKDDIGVPIAEARLKELGDAPAWAPMDDERAHDVEIAYQAYRKAAG